MVPGLCKGRIGVNIELKYYGHDQRLEQRVVDLVEAHRMQSEIVVMSLKHEASARCGRSGPIGSTACCPRWPLGDPAGLDVDFLAVNVEVDRPLVRAAHDSGKEVHVWTW